MGQTHRAKYSELPDSLIDILRGADHQEEEGDDEGDGSNNGHENVEDHLELGETFVYSSLLEDEHGAIGDDAPDPIVQLSLLGFSDACS